MGGSDRIEVMLTDNDFDMKEFPDVTMDASTDPKCIGPAGENLCDPNPAMTEPAMTDPKCIDAAGVNIC